MRNSERIRARNPLLAEYVNEVERACNRWRRKTGRLSRHYKHPVSFFQWRKKQL